MPNFHGFEEGRVGLAPSTDVRLPVWQSLLLIAVLSALCWAALIYVVMALRDAL